ncbi:MAG: tRNA (adenosine(37)-N6)-threonylcarbamoyltransferase complex ATPase subunit type 1 TsaE [Candidatus Kappaea frigidicola]|nr:tRNA (adenosine(37)-N6)-threonylcarbamoyltransferase complex ATPase subunit type 1 TsaE [Candidatus Kappaea frigidicola]
MKSLISKSDQETKRIAARLAKYLKAQDFLALCGDLGTGKTTFVKGLARGLGIKEEQVISPSFMLIRQYKGKLPLYHFDLYRLDYLEQVEFLGYEEYFYGEGVCCMEWANKIEELLPAEYLQINIKFLSEHKRKITFKSVSDRYNNIIGKL